MQLRAAIEELTAGDTFVELFNADKALRSRYQASGPLSHAHIRSKNERHAYLATRMPATHAAVTDVLNRIKQQAPDLSFRSLLDLGSGTGAVLWAATEIFPELHEITMIERDADLLRLCQQLSTKNPLFATKKISWRIANLETVTPFEAKADLVTFSYSIGELPFDQMVAIAESAWQATQQVLVIIEPGTVAGFTRIRQLRDHLIQLGAHIIAPCTHAKQCPIQKGDWCHFSTRLERSSLHRRLKEGSLGFEDEKFSYIVASKLSIHTPSKARILRHPLKYTGHLKFTVCTAEGICQSTISKKTAEFYKQARKLEWGDSLTQNQVINTNK